MRDSVYEVESPVQYRRTLIYKQTIYQLYKFLRFEATLAFEDIIAASENIFRGRDILKNQKIIQKCAKPQNRSQYMFMYILLINLPFMV